MNDRGVKASIAANQNSKDKNYWINKLEGQLVISSFPFDYRLAKKSTDYDFESITLPNDLSYKLIRLSNGSDYALHVILLTAVSLLLSRYSNHNDIIVGTSIYKQANTGEYINKVLSLRNQIESDMTFKDLLLEMKRTVTEANDHQNYPIEVLERHLQIVNPTSRKFSLFDVVVLLDNIQDKQYIENVDVNMVFVFNREQSGLSVQLQYNSACYDNETINRIMQNLQAILNTMVIHVSEPIAQFCLLSLQEKDTILNVFNNTKRDYSEEKHITEIIDQQAERYPYRIALEYENETMTYKELSEKTDVIANALRNKYKIKMEQLVAIVMDRSIDFVVSMLGIWKAGGAYVPIDPNFPQERTKALLRDAGIKLAISEERYFSIFSEYQEHEDNELYVLSISEMQEYQTDRVTINEHPETTSEDLRRLAYVIYTSGSTGNPKGAMVEHLGMMNHIRAKIEDLEMTEQTILAQNASQCFDISVWQFLTPLIVGGKTVIYSNDSIMNPSTFLSKILDDKISILEVVPSYLSVINDLIESEQFKNITLKYIVVTGEEVKPKLVKQIFDKLSNIRIVNAYGPTEASDDITHHIMAEAPVVDTIPIGKPVRNFTIYIVDQNMQLCPIGVKGEICVAGIGVGRGYLNDEVKTNNVFVHNPFLVDDNKMYKTGDVGCWLPDGSITYFGRKDYQLKIRGHRIEPNEIEKTIASFPNVKETVVMAHEKEDGGKFLCAYVVMYQHSQTTSEELREYLKGHLPDYMIPNYIIQLDKFDLTYNGKIDRKSLPMPRSNDSTESVLPSGHIEEVLIKVFSEVLRADNVSVASNFFELGGDSISAMQIAARVQKYGYFVNIKDILNYVTIMQLKNHVTLVNRNIDQGTVEGELPLTPIQHWFFDQNFTNKHHYNQSVILHAEQGFDKKIISNVFKQMVRHHDALRIVYAFSAEGIRQMNNGISDELIDIEEIILKENCDVEVEIEKKSAMLQSQLNLTEGPLMKLALFKGFGAGDYLLILVHHLLIDAVSWRIVMDDFATGYQQALQGEDIVFQDKTESYMTWANKLKEYGNRSELPQEMDYWKSIVYSNVEKLPRDFIIEESERIVHNMKVIEMKLNSDLTDTLLKRVTQNYDSEINDILLTALGMAIKKWCGIERISVNLEGHGREGGIYDLNVNRTVGWFTSLFPVMLNSNEHSLRNSIDSIKKSLRDIPNKGFGYGIIKYLLSDNGDIKDQMHQFQPEILFNYLGQFNNHDYDNMFKILDMNMGEIKKGMSMGSTLSPQSEILHTFEISCEVIDGELSISFGYNRAEYSERNVQQLVTDYYGALINMIESVEQLAYFPCFFNSFFPVIKHFKKGITPFLINDVVVYTRNSTNSTNFDIEYIENQTAEEICKNQGISFEVDYAIHDIIGKIKTTTSKKRPILIWIDCYYESIKLDSYMKFHQPHTLFIYGYNEKEDMFTVMERGTLSYESKLIPANDIKQAYESYIQRFYENNSPTFYEFYPTLEHQLSYDFHNFKSILNNNLLLHRDSIEEGLRHLSSFVGDYKMIVSDEEVLQTHHKELIEFLNKVILAKQFEKYRLIEIQINNPLLIDLADRIIETWSYVRAVLIKYIYSSKYSYRKFDVSVQKLSQLPILESDFYDQLFSGID